MTHTRKHTSRVHNERLAAPCGSSDFEELSKTSPQAQRKVPVGVSTLPTSNLSQFYEHTDTSAPTHAHIHKHIPCRHLRPASSFGHDSTKLLLCDAIFFFSHSPAVTLQLLRSLNQPSADSARHVRAPHVPKEKKANRSPKVRCRSSPSLNVVLHFLGPSMAVSAPSKRLKKKKDIRERVVVSLVKG